MLSAFVAFDCVVGLSRPLGPGELASLSPSGWVKTCPKCGRAPGGSPNCCSPGGSWFGKCSVKSSKAGAPTFPEGFEACNDKTEIERKQEHEKVVFTAVREKDLAEQKVTEDVDALVAATKRDAEAEADRRVAAAKSEAEADADRRVEAVKRDTEATAERRVAKEAARALKAEEEKAKVVADAKEVKAALEAKDDKEKAEAEAKEVVQARAAAEAKEAETAQKLKEYKEGKEAEKERKAKAEAKEVADKALQAEIDKKRAKADTVILAAAQKASMEAAKVVREAEEAAAEEEERDRMEAETLRAEAAKAEERAALKEAEAMKLEEETERVATDAASEEKDKDANVPETDAASDEEEPPHGAAVDVGSDATEPSATTAAEARETLASEKDQADAIQAAMEWQSREIVVPRDGYCEHSELSAALRSVVVTTKDGTCKDSSKWKMLDPSLDLRIFDDKAAETLVREHYPDLLATYQGLAHGVERADLFRYLAIHLEGGIYADCDVEPNACVSKWLKEYEWLEGREGLRINSSVPLLVVGVEFDAEGGWILESLLNNGTAKNNGTSRIQLCQWIFAATAPRHPALVSVMGEVQARVASFPDNTNLITDRTGPVAWTAGVMRYIRRYNVSGEDLLPVRKLDHHGQLFQLREPSGMESQVLLLPYRAFAYPGAHGPGVFEEPARQKLVHHMFKGSWKPSLRHKVTDLMGLADSQRGHRI